MARGTAPHAAELLVVDQFVDHRPLGIGPELELPKLHAQGIKEEQPAAQGGADTGDDFHGLGGLNHPNDSGEYAHHAALGAGRNHARRRWLGEEVAVVRALGIQVEHRGLAFKTEDRAVHVGFAEQHAGVVHQVTGREVVGAVANDVVTPNDLEGVVTGERCFVEIHLAVGIDLEDAGLGRFDLGLAHPGGAVDHLALQIAVVNHVEIDNAQAAHTRRRQIEQQWRTQAAGANAKHRSGLEALLPLHPNLGKDQVPGKTGHLIGAELNTAGVGRKHGKQERVARKRTSS